MSSKSLLISGNNSLPELCNNSILLRELNSSDVKDLNEWMPDESLYIYWGKRAGKTDKNPALMFEGKQTQRFYWGIVDRESRKVVGDFYLYLIENNRMAKIAFRVSNQFQRRGIATMATQLVLDFVFRETTLKRIWTDVDVRNTASEKVLTNTGFTKEGMIRQGKMVNTYCDYYIYGILKEDYLSNTE